jgi:SAM-dependent methyltransferase
MQDVPPELAGHPDRLRWNAKYEDGSGASFVPHPLAVRALSMTLPDGPVLDLACGPSGSALLAAAAGRRVTAVDISEAALGLLDQEARRGGLSELITLVHADLGEWRPGPRCYSLVLCTGYWDRAVFSAATGAVTPGGVLGWEAFTADARRVRPRLPAEWCLDPGEPASLLPADFTVLGQDDLPDVPRGAKRRLLARRRTGSGPDSRLTSGP